LNDCSQRIVQSIPEMRLGDDVLRMSRIGLQFDTQTAYDTLYIIGCIALLRTPHPL
jgi:hypothetical protein